ncbi:MAG: hypothetical protein IIT86_00380 [Oscillospiraceae bacterium]|nr:hypothetical protein [Oscillospiraceae bacterium]
MKTLITIQTLAKIGKAFSKIIYVCCIVGFCGCIVGIVSLAIGAETFKLGGVSVHSMIENKAGMNLPTLYASMAVGLLFCASEAVLCKFAEIYFKNELADGNPFTLRGAKELMRLGILTVAIPLGTVIICSIGVSIADNVYPGIDKLSIGEFSSVGLGIMMIVLSLFCRYGAELNEGKPDACHE